VRRQLAATVGLAVRAVLTGDKNAFPISKRQSGVVRVAIHDAHISLLPSEVFIDKITSGLMLSLVLILIGENRQILRTVV
jgi:hypothetical protein